MDKFSEVYKKKFLIDNELYSKEYISKEAFKALKNRNPDQAREYIYDRFRKEYYVPKYQEISEDEIDEIIKYKNYNKINLLANTIIGWCLFTTIILCLFLAR